MPKRFDFPVWLKGTPEEQKAEAEVQEIRRASFGRGHLTEEERMVGRGVLLEETALGNLEQSRGKNAAARELGENQLADAYAMQGQFALAATTHNDAERRAFFRSVVDAIEMEDGEKCSCPDTVATLGETQIAVTPRFERDRIFSPVHGQIVSLVECRKCGHRNARPLKSRLLISNSTMHRNQVAAGSSAALIRDIELLRT